MRIVDIFDAVREGTYEEFLEYYTGDANLVDKYEGMNLLSLALVNDNQSGEKLKIIKFLISEGADINFLNKPYGRNALHTFYFSILKPTKEYLQTITELLVEAGIDVNQKDKFDAIPLKYAITITKLSTEEMVDTYKYLLHAGSDYKHKDTFGKSCEDYAKEYSWRNDVIEIIEEYEKTT